MREVQLTQGYVALVDDEDYERVSHYKWSVSIAYQVNNKRMRAVTCIADGVFVLMHRFILGVTDQTIDVDHKDGNGLNNQKENLRQTSRGQNLQNIRVVRSRTGVRGVTRLRSGKYMVQVQRNYVNHYFGTYDTLEEAERVAIAARQKLFTHSSDND
jgi:hypothetical protein